MELTESPFSGMSDRVEKDEEAKKQAAEQSLHTLEEAEQHKSPVQSSTKASDSGLEQTKKASSRSPEEDDGDTPRRLPVARAEKTQVNPTRPLITLRQNVIPSRRITVESTKEALPSRGSTIPADNTRTTTIATPNAASTASNEVAGPPIPNHLSPPNEGALTSTQATDFPHTDDVDAFAPLPVAYHDTSAAEAAWKAEKMGNEISEQDTHVLTSVPQKRSDYQQSTEESKQREAMAAIATTKMATLMTPLPPVPPLAAEPSSLSEIPTTPLPVFAPVKPLERQTKRLSRKKALLLVALLAIILVNATVVGFNQFFGPQGWGSVWNAPTNGGPNLLTQIAQQLRHSPTPSSKGTPTQPTPMQIVNLLMSNMTLDEKLGQMMMVQFAGQSYSTDLDTMISQYHVGSVLYFQFNIASKSQLTGLNTEMQHNANLPLVVTVDQEGGTVDRLVNLDGAQPSASQIGASNNPNVAYEQGLKDARDLASYGFNLNLAPVVDVNNVYNPQLYDRTYGNNPTLVSQMAEKYLEGLQHSGKVLGTLKHFPGLGDVSTDPHYGLPALTRDLNSLNTIDWAPYSNLIKQGHVSSIMVTHEIVDALDKTEPSSLSPQVIGILRNQMHFQGVIITDSLTMDSIHNFYTYGDAAAKAVEVGDDILMGADSPSTLAQMITGIKQAMSSGAITQQHIDDSVRRILLLKYEMGLLHV
ncbi:MAG TPA: glycoside hydrolase family 3 N-terminal domain-containing protein [Ktedonobacteraceae bacterium]|jgi:beta-N-acetylhexosaminidase